MSAFIMNKENIQQIYEFGLYTQEFDIYGTHKIEPLLNHYGCMREVKENLGQDLLKLNYDSVNGRYNDNQQPPKFKRDLQTLDSNQVINFKNLGCYLYQSCEAEQDQSKLYKALREVENRLAKSIVSSLPEYETAPWG